MQIFKTSEIVGKQLFHRPGAEVVLPAIGAVGIFAAVFLYLRALVEVRVDHTEIIHRRVLPDTDLAHQLNGIFPTIGAWQSISEKRSLRNRANQKHIVVEVYKMLRQPRNAV